MNTLKTTVFNLTTEPWIPVQWRSPADQVPVVSLRDAFLRGPEIRDLAVRPHERIALMRLLLCIAHAAMPVASFSQRRTSWSTDIRDKATAYLARWSGSGENCRFNLFDEKWPFLQVIDLEADEKKRVELLDPSLALDNSSTLFDQAGGTFRSFTPAQTALMLLCHQNFALGMPVRVAKWGGTPTLGTGGKPAKDGKCWTSASICAANAAIHGFPLGENLLETIHLNLLDGRQIQSLGFRDDEIGKPIWELLPSSNREPDRIRNASETFLGRLVPLARLVRLLPEPDGSCRTAYISNGLDYRTFWHSKKDESKSYKRREPTTAIFGGTDKKTGKVFETPVEADSGAAIWRQIHSLTLAMHSNAVQAPPAFENVWEHLEHDEQRRFRLWAGAFLCKQGKIHDSVESVYEMPGRLLTEPGYRDYEDGISFVEKLARLLATAVETYYRLPANEGRGGRTESSQIKKLKEAATTDFWSVAEQRQRELAGLAGASIGSDFRGRDGKIQFTALKHPWTEAMKAIVREAYRRACPAVTARQIEAFAAGWAVLAPKRRAAGRANKRPNP